MIEVLDTELRPARYLVVAFTGLFHELGGIPFEFYKSLSHLDCAPMFVKDRGERWYQYPEPEIAAVVERIRIATLQTGAARVICLGNSMGGFGALLFGSLCHADAMLAFVPQTAIVPTVLIGLGDSRYDAWVSRISEFPMGDLLDVPPARGRSLICIGEDECLDRLHAERLRAIWGCEQLTIPDVGHDVAARLRDDAELLPLIDNVMRGAEPSATQ